MVCRSTGSAEEGHVFRSAHDWRLSRTPVLLWQSFADLQIAGDWWTLVDNNAKTSPVGERGAHDPLLFAGSSGTPSRFPGMLDSSGGLLTCMAIATASRPLRRTLVGVRFRKMSVVKRINLRLSEETGVESLYRKTTSKESLETQIWRQGKYAV